MENEVAVKRSVKVFLVVIAVSVFFACLTGYAKYIFAKDYYFFVEASCDNTTQTCFVRDCDDYCPPNSLETYRTFTVKAADYQQCQTNSCSNFCTIENNCEEVLCDPQAGDECSE